MIPTQPKRWKPKTFFLYASGTTGKPKGIMHTTASYQVFSYFTAKYVFDLTDNDVYWYTADIGWITGHTYIIYGITQNCATQVMYEGAPNTTTLLDSSVVVDLRDKYTKLINT